MGQFVVRKVLRPVLFWLNGQNEMFRLTISAETKRIWQLCALLTTHAHRSPLVVSVNCLPSLLLHLVDLFTNRCEPRSLQISIAAHVLYFGPSPLPQFVFVCFGETKQTPLELSWCDVGHVALLPNGEFKLFNPSSFPPLKSNRFICNPIWS